MNVLNKVKNTLNKPTLDKRTIRLILIRHGESMGNLDPYLYNYFGQENVPLSDKGVRQSKGLKYTLAGMYLKNPKYYTSGYVRTKQTAYFALGEEEGITDFIQEDPLLNEMSSHGFSDKTYTKFKQDNPDYEDILKGQSKWDFNFPKCETYSEVEDRVHAFIKKLERSSHEGEVIVFSHYLTIKVFEKVIRRLPSNNIQNQEGLQNCGILELELEF